MTESQEQAKFVKWFRSKYPSEAMALRVSMNGITFGGSGKWGAIMWNKMKAQGLAVGEPDIMICLPSRGFRNLVIEHKALLQQHGITEEQEEHLFWHAARGNLAVLTKGIDNLKELVEEYMSHAKTNT